MPCDKGAAAGGRSSAIYGRRSMYGDHHDDTAVYGDGRTVPARRRGSPAARRVALLHAVASVRYDRAKDATTARENQWSERTSHACRQTTRRQTQNRRRAHCTAPSDIPPELLELYGSYLVRVMDEGKMSGRGVTAQWEGEEQSVLNSSVL